MLLSVQHLPGPGTQFSVIACPGKQGRLQPHSLNTPTQAPREAWAALADTEAARFHFGMHLRCMICICTSLCTSIYLFDFCTTAMNGSMFEGRHSRQAGRLESHAQDKRVLEAELWTGSAGLSDWWRRQQAYATSLGAMSMVGAAEALMMLQLPVLQVTVSAHSSTIGWIRLSGHIEKWHVRSVWHPLGAELLLAFVLPVQELVLAAAQQGLGL